MHTPQNPELVIRKLLIHLDLGFPRHWNGNEAFSTQYYNAFSMSFPAGEQAFIDSIRECLPLLPMDACYDDLRISIKGFIGQEATHRRVHERFNAVLADQGLKNHWEQWITKRLAKYKAMGVHPLNFLATTAAYEHMTAVFADLHLARSDLLANATPEMQALWRWHSAEESEHRSVAFDLYKACGGHYRHRILAFIHAVYWFNVEATAQTLSNLWHDKTLFKPLTWWRAAVYFWHPQQGMTWAIIKPFAAYFKRDFHPWKNRSVLPAQTWLQDNQKLWQAVGVNLESLD